MIAFQRQVISTQLLSVWISTVISLFVQVAFVSTYMHIIVGLWSNYLNSLTLAYLILSIHKIKFPLKFFTATMVISFIPAYFFYKEGYSFAYMSFFTALAVALPLYYVAIKTFFWKWSKNNIFFKCLSTSYFFFALHYLDYPFLRVHPQYSDEGFALGVIIIMAISIFALAAVIEDNLKKEGEILEEKLEDQEKFVSEYDVAKEIQKQYLPNIIPEFKKFHIGHYFKASRKVSGDFYDVFALNAHEIIVSLTDVTGKGLSASFITIELYHILKSIFYQRTVNVGDMMCKLNESIYALRAQRKGCASFLLKVNQKKELITYSDAGIGVAYLIRNHSLIELREGGILLGALKKSAYDVETIALEKGDVVFISTDGLIDAKHNKERFSEDRLVKILESYTKEKDGYLIDKIKYELKVYFDNNEDNDDITIFTVEYK